MAKTWQAGEFVGPGERRTAEYLERHLPASWDIVCNKELVNPDSSAREIDFIIVGEHVVFAVEEKSWTGVVHGSDRGWVLDSGASYPSPISTVGSLARRLAGLLRANVPHLGDFREHIVLPRVLMSDPSSVVRVNDPRMHEQVLALAGCEDDLVRIDALQGAGPASISAIRQRVMTQLVGLPERPAIPSRVGTYTVLERLSVGPSTRRLLARHDDGSLRVLDIIERPTTTIAERYEEEQNARLRGYKAVAKLAGSGVAPAVDPYFYWSDDQYWVVTYHLLSGRTIRADRSASSPTPSEVASIVSTAFASLARVHERGIVHRSLDPDHVQLLDGGAVAFSGFELARISGDHTVADAAASFWPEAPYASPEVRVGLAFALPASDVYSLALTLLYWISGVEPDADGTWEGADERAAIGEAIGEEGLSMLTRCLEVDEGRRPSAADVVAALAVAVDRGPHRPERHDGLADGELVHDQYRIVRTLGEGATAVTYLAEDLMADSLVVLKAIKNPELRMKLAKTEFRTLRSLTHPNLPRVLDVRPPADVFQLKLEYVRGSALRELEEARRGDITFALRVGSEILSALTYLEERSLIHRDVSPGNILIPDEESGRVRLIDFGVASWDADSVTAVGTPRYRAPEIDRGGRWEPTADRYALAVVLFELLTGRLPYEVDDGTPRKERLVRPEPSELETLGSGLLNALLRAASPDPDGRYRTADEFEDALRASVVETVPSLGDVLVNPTVTEIRRAYRNSRIGNADNRGLDSDFAERTYVDTLLDTALLPRVLEGAYSLVVLSGNPGDGKTAFLQRVHKSLAGRAEVRNADAAGWSLEVDGHRLAALYDASESHEGSSADVLLTRLLEPLAGDAAPGPGYTALVAVNDGRLIEFFESHSATYPWLWVELQRQIFEDGPAGQGVVVLDLKRRGLVELELSSSSIAARLTDEFVRPDRWSVCGGCAARDECPIRFNALSLAGEDGDGPRRGILALMLAVHLQRERRPTVRDLRSALAFLITHDIGCADVREDRDSGVLATSAAGRLYFNAAFDGSGSPDLLLDEWVKLDPAEVSTPRLDRFLYFHRTPDQNPEVDRLFGPSPSRPTAPLRALRLGAAADWMSQMKRRFAFEGVAEGVTDGPSVRAVQSYRHFEAFRSILRREADDAGARATILAGLSSSDGIPLESVRDGLALRVSDEGRGDLLVVKIFEAREFRLEVPAVASPYIEIVDDELRLVHGESGAALTVGLNLFEFLCRLVEGYMPGAEEQRAMLEDLSSFKARLLARPTREVLLIEAGLRRHLVTARDGALVREAAR